MQNYKHGATAVLRPHLFPFLVGEVGGTRWEGPVRRLQLLMNNKVDGKSAVVYLVVSVKDLAPPVYLRPLGLCYRPHGLEMTVEKQRVELAGRHRSLDHPEQVGLGAVLLTQGEGIGRVCVFDARVPKPVHGESRGAQEEPAENGEDNLRAAAEEISKRGERASEEEQSEDEEPEEVRWALLLKADSGQTRAV